MKGSVGQAMQLKWQRDPAKHIGPLQQQIIDLLGIDSLPQETKDYLLKVYLRYQEKNKIYPKDCVRVTHLWKDNFNP